MSKFVIVIFSDGMKAQKGALALEELHREANATIYGTAVVRLEMNRGLVIVQPTDQGTLPLGVGALVEGLVAFFESSAGIPARDGSEAPTGESWRDYLRTEVSDDSLADLALALQPDKFALITEVAEECVAPIATRMRAVGGRIVHVQRENFTADVLTKEKEAVIADVDQWKADHAAIKARAMERDLAKRIDETRAKLRRTADIARLRQDRLHDEMDAKLNALEEQAALATPDIRNRIEQRLGELRNDLGERTQKLARAYELTQEALHA